jgi:hypothetical protein
MDQSQAAVLSYNEPARVPVRRAENLHTVEPLQGAHHVP